MIVDAHMHIWGKVHGTIGGTLPVRPLGNGMIRIGKSPLLGMPATFTDCAATAERAVADFDAAGVDVGVVVQEYMDGPQNDYLLRVRKKFADRFFFHTLADFWKPQRTASEAVKLFGRGFRGLKLSAGHLAGKVRLDDARFFPIWARMEDESLVLAVDLSTGQSQVGEMRTILARHPRLRVAIGHFGMVNRDGWPGQLDLCRYKNVYMETGGIIWLYRHEGYPFPGAIKAIKRARNAVGIEKLMWGSDWPRPMVDFTYRQSLAFVRDESNGLSDADKRLLLGGNAARLYRIKPTNRTRTVAALITQG